MKQDSKYKLFHILDIFYTRTDIYHYSTFDLNYIFYNQIYIRMIHVLLILFIPGIILKPFKSSLLFRTHTLLKKSLRVLQLLTDPPKLTVNG